MFFPEGRVRVFVYGRPVDMRLGFAGLYALTRHRLGHDPMSGHLLAPALFHRSSAGLFREPSVRISRIAHSGGGVLDDEGMREMGAAR